MEVAPREGPGKQPHPTAAAVSDVNARASTAATFPHPRRLAFIDFFSPIRPRLAFPPKPHPYTHTYTSTHTHTFTHTRTFSSGESSCDPAPPPSCSAHNTPPPPLRCSRSITAGPYAPLHETANRTAAASNAACVPVPLGRIQRHTRGALHLWPHSCPRRHTASTAGIHAASGLSYTHPTRTAPPSPVSTPCRIATTSTSPIQRALVDNSRAHRSLRIIVGGCLCVFVPVRVCDCVCACVRDGE